MAVLVFLLGLVAVAGVDAAAARADMAVIPAGTPDPWSDPNHQGVLERFASNVASAMAGRPVSVRCEDQATWNTLNSSQDAPNILGFVTKPPHSTTTMVIRWHYVWRWHVVHGKRTRYRRKVSYTAVITHADTFVSSATTVELAPKRSCWTPPQPPRTWVSPTRTSPTMAGGSRSTTLPTTCG